MASEIGSHIVEFRCDEALEVFKALALESRIAIVQLLASGDRNINEIGTALNLSQPTVTKHIQQLEQAGIVRSEYMPGVQGMQKRCSLRFGRLIIRFEPNVEVDDRVEEVSMPIGLYTQARPNGTCGLASRVKLIGFLDRAQSFYDPERATAEILWMAGGHVEYMFANDLPPSMDITRVELIMEACSEAPDYNIDWPSDITVWLNGVEIGTWTCPGDFGGTRGLLNPDWWIEHMTQYGLLKIWSVDEKGAYVDGIKISDVNIGALGLTPQVPVTVRIGVKEDAEHPGGFNLFGKGFGNYAQDLVIRYHYVRNAAAERRANMASEESEA